jgi:hypothetical protein
MDKIFAKELAKRLSENSDFQDKIVFMMFEQQNENSEKNTVKNVKKTTEKKTIESKTKEDIINQIERLKEIEKNL